jgi:integrase/recombinase XerD
MACWSTHQPSTSADPQSHRSRPRWGFTHLQFEALLTAARQSANPCDFALVAMLGLRIFEATSAYIADLG